MKIFNRQNAQIILNAATPSILALALAGLSLPGMADAQANNATVKLAIVPKDSAFEGVVEAKRQTVIAAQVEGAIVELPVKAGDVVKQGQLLAKIDSRSADQGKLASHAQSLAARSAFDLATKDVERQRHLFEKQYISQSAMERAEAQYRAAQEQYNAQMANASAATIQSGFYVIRAPYAGVIAEVPAMPGDMAMPGKPLLTIYDPLAMRVTASIPQSAVATYDHTQPARVELPSLPKGQQWLDVRQAQILPVIDAGTHTAQVRIDLQRVPAGVVPGMFARVWLHGTADSGNSLSVPKSAIVRHAEMTGIYVINGDKKLVLRQVRLGVSQGDQVEVLSGLNPGEQISLQPQAELKEQR